MRAWIVSLLFYSTVIALCQLLRLVIAKYFQAVNRKDKIRICDVSLEVIILEWIGTIQVCAPIFDVNFVVFNYGLFGVVIEIVIIELMNSFFLKDAIADPCTLFGNYLKKKFSWLNLCVLLATQFAAGYTSYIIVKSFWKIGLNDYHIQSLTNNCSSDLTVTIIYGSIIEATGFIVLKLAEHFFEQQISNTNIFVFVNALMSGIVTMIGIELTGMYANPIVAWACTFNCGDVSHLAQFIVYWVAPFIGWCVVDQFLSHHKQIAPIKNE